MPHHVDNHALKRIFCRFSRRFFRFGRAVEAFHIANQREHLGTIAAHPSPMDCDGSQHHYSQHADANHDVAVTGTVNLLHLLAQTVGVKLCLVACQSVGGGGGIQ